MESTNQENVQDAQSTEVNPQGDDGRQANNQYENLSKEDLLNLLVQREERLHEVNNESKQRKLKLRELETQQQELRERSLQEKEEYKTLYTELKNQTQDYDELRSFRESILEANKQKLVDLEKQLTASERVELDIIGEIPIDKKLRWVETKIKNRSSINIDNSTSMQAGGSLKKLPQNRREMALLTPDDVKKFKSQYPSVYNEAIKKP